MKEAVIVSAVRTTVGRAVRGVLKDVRPETLGVLVVNEALRRVPNLEPSQVEDVVMGCAMPEGAQGMNLGRVIAWMSDVPDANGITVNRFCSSGLQTIAQSAMAIMSGMNDVVIAGGVESMSSVPMGGFTFSAHPDAARDKVDIYTPMGITSENVAKEFKVSREEQDEYACNSHMKAAKAWKDGLFDDEVIKTPYVDAAGNEKLLEIDESIRAETTVESLSKLRPVFSPTGSVTAGNSSPTNDGASAVVMMSADKAKELGIKPLAYFRDFQVATCPPHIMGIGPAVAIPKLWKHSGIGDAQIPHYEINEAFASQAKYCVDKLGIDPAKVNPQGGAIALGHPLGCTGAKLTTSLVYNMVRNQYKYGVVSMCIGGGMGAAGLFELA